MKMSWRVAKIIMAIELIGFTVWMAVATTRHRAEMRRIDTDGRAAQAKYTQERAKDAQARSESLTHQAEFLHQYTRLVFREEWVP